MARRLALALLAALAPLASACVTPPDAASVAASAGGTGPDDAYVVQSVAQEYEILRLLGLEMEVQSLHVIDGKPFDVLEVRDPANGGAEREVWFDISRFFGRNY